MGWGKGLGLGDEMGLEHGIGLGLTAWVRVRV